MLYQDIADILKKARSFTLTTPDVNYTNINYSEQQNKTLLGNYASEAYNDSPSGGNRPQRG